MKNHDNILELYLKLMPAQFFMVIASSLSGMINGLIIGNCLSGIAMVAMTLTQPFLNIITGISSIISGGAGILCGNYMGKGDAKKVNQVYTVSMITRERSSIMEPRPSALSRHLSISLPWLSMLPCPMSRRALPM